MPRVQEWIDDRAPDVLCLQETKLASDAFPYEAFEEMGYEACHHGEGRWNGVAIASRVGLDDVVLGFSDGLEEDPQARLIRASCNGIRVACVYVPNGRSLDDDHYVYKLQWFERLTRVISESIRPDEKFIACGDFNVAPDDRDVWDPAEFIGATHVSHPERAALAQLMEWGVIDVFRRHHDDGNLFSWWDYRGGSFHKGLGMRIDLILATEPVVGVTDAVWIDRDARKGQKPSDHAPVVIDMDI